SYVYDRWGAYGVRVAWVSIVAMAFGHIALDAFDTGINAFWPIYDQFYRVSGHLVLAYQGGFTVDFIEVTELGTTGDIHYRTGFDSVDADGARRFPVSLSGEQFVLLVVSGLVVGRRLVEDQRAATTAPATEYMNED
ncbi:MAG: metal-dependent hydrolase, partial [Halalkalicoccus sp.]